MSVSWLGSALGFVLVIVILVGVHEWGHYWAARRVGVQVQRFSIGMGPVLFRRQWRGTEWVLSALPLGGYVKLLDEREAPVPLELKSQAFNHKRPGQKALVLVMGPMANLVLAAVLLSLLSWLGRPVPVPYVAQPMAHTPAAQAGLAGGEKIISVNGMAVDDFSDVSLFAHLASQQLELVTSRQSYVLERVDSSVPWGLRPLEPKLPARLGRVVADMPAAAAGLRAGDVITSINGRPVQLWSELVAVVSASAAQPLDLQVQRQGQQLSFTVRPQASKVGGVQVGRLGVSPDVSAYQPERHSPERGVVEAVWLGVYKTWGHSALLLGEIGKLITGRGDASQLGGPVAIAQFAGLSLAAGWVTLLQFLAGLSISLGVLNLLPLPLLDGGQLALVGWEKWRGRPLSEKAEAWLARVGITLLLSLLVFSTWQDISRLVMP